MSTESNWNCRTVEEWAERYIHCATLTEKLSPPTPPETWGENESPRQVVEPGRPPQLRAAKRGRSRTTQLTHPTARAKLLHAFFHHELQAAELMCWAILKWPDAERGFRKGLLSIALDEIRHANAYQTEIKNHGHAIGDFAVRDWFWFRVPKCQSKLQFVALMGMGLEAANLEHAEHYEEQFRLVGATSAAELQTLIGEEERAHVAFAAHWFQRWTGAVDFDRWCESLPPPLSPLLMRGKRLNRPARLSAGLPSQFIEALNAWQP